MRRDRTCLTCAAARAAFRCTLRFTALLPCGSGEALNLNPSLLTDFLRTQGAAPVWQCRVVRTHLYNKAGKDFE